MFWRISGFIVGVVGLCACIVLAFAWYHLSDELTYTWDVILMMGAGLAAILVGSLISASLMLQAMWSDD